MITEFFWLLMIFACQVGQSEDLLPAEDCGLHCLYVAACAFGDDTCSYSELKKMAGPTPNGGFSIEELRVSAIELGLNARAVKTSLANLRRRGKPFAAILLFNGNHFVLATGLKKDSIDVVDPPRSRNLLDQEVGLHWEGYALLISPNEISSETWLSTKAIMQKLIVGSLAILTIFFGCRFVKSRFSSP